jgi:hypothetical protein
VINSREFMSTSLSSQCFFFFFAGLGLAKIENLGGEFDEVPAVIGISF